MADNLVIVESPAKAKTIQKFLGDGYEVKSSFGHIRDLQDKKLSVDVEKGFTPEYVVPADKKKVVGELRKAAEKASTVWLASDEDREGEAISWHLFETLGLKKEQTRRIVFHEITKDAIVNAVRNPRSIDMNLVNAQQARRVLDRLVGFELSPILWRKIQPKLSAGRVQSVALRLVVEREKEIMAFRNEAYYKVEAVFHPDGYAESVKVKAILDTRFKTIDEARGFLQECIGAAFTVSDVEKKEANRFPAAPFTTSTLQQEAARKLRFPVSTTMRVAQSLYERGLITYMRTDSTNLSSLALGTAKKFIIENFGEEYSKTRQFKTHSKGAQEAHEAIRPTYMSETSIDGTSQEKRLYELIWKRTIASQMADAQIEKTTINIHIDNTTEKFVANGEVVVFDGFLKVYRESTDEDDNAEDSTHILPAMKEGDELQRREIIATEKFSLAPARYTEASLVKKLEDLGIGRPSTYAPTISTIQQREYVVKGDKQGVERNYTVDSLKGIKITQKTKKEMAGSEKGKLLPTDIGIVVNDFLMANFPNIMDYNFTAHVEQRFDDIAEGKTEWIKWMKDFDKGFEPEVKEVMNARSEHKAGERELGNDPKSGRPVFVKIGRFGPVVQIGTADDKDKPQFAQLPADKSIETITLEEALELFKLPRQVGEFEGTTVTIGAGRFGPYVLHNRKYVSIPKDIDPMAITLEQAIELINEKRSNEQKRHIKTFEEDEKLELLNGRYGPYIAYDGKNYRIPKAKQENVEALTYDECMTIIKEAPEPKTRGRKK